MHITAGLAPINSIPQGIVSPNGIWCRGRRPGGKRDHMSAIKKNRKLAAIVVAALGVVLAFGLASCGGSASSSASSASGSASASASASAASDDKVIKVAASPTPHAQILNDVVAPLVEKAGYKLEVVKEFTDYVLPNTATEDGEVDANYFQHIPYLENFNKEQGTHLVNVAGVHIEPMRIYAGKTAKLDELADGATVAVPNDTTNEARALLLLQTAGLIELNDPSNPVATPKDIKSNPKNLQFKEVEAATVPTILPTSTSPSSTRTTPWAPTSRPTRFCSPSPATPRT